MKSRQTQISKVLSKKINALQINNLQKQSLANNLSGTLQPSGMDKAVTGFFAPDGAKKVRFVCRPRASMATLCQCTVKAFGAEKIQSGWVSVFINNTIEIPLAASNCNVEISFSVMDSNGGMAKWEVLY